MMKLKTRNFKSPLSALTFLFFLCSITNLFAQKTDFSGIWVFKEQQSISGNLYSNGSPKQIKAVQRAGSISIEKITATGDGKDITTTETIGFDGNPFDTVTASKRKKIITLVERHAGYPLKKTSSAGHLTGPTYQYFSTQIFG